MKDQTETGNRRPGHPWSLYVCTLFGIPVYLHFTFLLLLIFVGLDSALGALMLAGVFGCVVLHELGHALTARAYGIKTEDIVLYPIGGVARLRSTGEGMQEFWIAIAGPLVNVAIAGILFGVLKASGQWTAPGQLMSAAGQSAEAAAEVARQVPMLQKLMIINIFLAVFNLIPAFPMDGGRILRSILTRWLPRSRATLVAARIGQGLAILFILYGLLGPQGINIMLMFIGLFIFLAAGQESIATQTIDLMTGKRAGDAMITRFEVLGHGDSLDRAAQLLLTTSQQDFPVIWGEEVMGVLTAKQLLKALAEPQRPGYVAQIMQRDYPRAQASEPLEKVMALIAQAGGGPVLVFNGEELAGYINQENLIEFLTLAKIANVTQGAAARS